MEHAEEKHTPLHGSMSSSWMTVQEEETEEPSLQAFKGAVSWSSECSNGHGKRGDLVRKKSEPAANECFCPD